MPYQIDPEILIATGVVLFAYFAVNLIRKAALKIMDREYKSYQDAMKQTNFDNQEYLQEE